MRAPGSTLVPMNLHSLRIQIHVRPTTSAPRLDAAPRRMACTPNHRAEDRGPVRKSAVKDGPNLPPHFSSLRPYALVSSRACPVRGDHDIGVHTRTDLGRHASAATGRLLAAYARFEDWEQA